MAPFLVGRVEARNPTGIDYGYHVGFRASTRPTEKGYKSNLNWYKTNISSGQD